MNIDLTNLSRKELLSLSKDIEKALADAEARDRKAALEAAKAAASEFGFTLDEISGTGKSSQYRRTVSEPKYYNPKDPTQTWTGKGRKPNWFTAELNAGTNPSDMEL